MSFRLTLLATVALIAADPVQARNILIANDDGLTSNVKALYDALKAEGHDVIVAVPCSQQSGMGGALRILRPLGPLQADCLNQAAKIGEPGAGAMTRPDLGLDFYYVDGTPVMAMLYGLDIVARNRWSREPDLVLSGPNIGQNAGSIVISSGTVSNAQYAMIRGIPAIALSAGENTASGPDLQNDKSRVVARLSLELLHNLERGSARKALLPAGTGLNVNFPDEPQLAKWKMARIGKYMRYDVRFVENLAAVNGRQQAQQGAAKPGLTIAISGKKPGPDELNDEAAVINSAIAISVMQVGYDAPAFERKGMKKRLKTLLSR